MPTKPEPDEVQLPICEDISAYGAPSVSLLRMEWPSDVSERGLPLIQSSEPPALHSHKMGFSRFATYGELRIFERDVSAPEIGIGLKDPPAQWRLNMAPPSYRNLQDAGVTGKETEW